MKNPNFERRLRAMRTYHANKRGSQFDGGVRVFHRYDEFVADDLSWWDDCQIIVNRRRVMIWWVHPRFKYRNAIEDAAWAAAGEPPTRRDWLADMRSRPVRKKVGRSRTRIVAYGQGEPNAEYQAYYARLRAEEDRIAAAGIDLIVRPSLSQRTLDWCTGLELCIPVEVRNVAELKALADIGRRLLKGETKLGQVFGDYAYGRDQWLAEEVRREGRGKFSEQLLSMPMAGNLTG
jgi:hypothetical protein